MKGKHIWRQMACLCLMPFLAGNPGMVGASGRVGDGSVQGRDTLQSPAQWGKGSVEFFLTQPGEFGETMLAVVPREPLEDVHLLTLQVSEVSDSGQVTWQVETDEPLGNLEPGTRYNYPMALEGTARATALSYWDRKGYHRKIFQISGKDGSLVVREE